MDRIRILLISIPQALILFFHYCLFLVFLVFSLIKRQISIVFYSHCRLKTTDFPSKAVFLFCTGQFRFNHWYFEAIFAFATSMIPSEYFQIPLSDLFASGVGTFVEILAVTAIGSFLGVLLGNLFFGPLTIVLIFFLMSGFTVFTIICKEFLSFFFYGKGGHLVLNNLLE